MSDGWRGPHSASADRSQSGRPPIHRGVPISTGTLGPPLPASWCSQPPVSYGQPPPSSDAWLRTSQTTANEEGEQARRTARYHTEESMTSALRFAASDEHINTIVLHYASKDPPVISPIQVWVARMRLAPNRLRVDELERHAPSTENPDDKLAVSTALSKTRQRLGVSTPDNQYSEETQ